MSERFFRRFSSFRKNQESVIPSNGDQNKNTTLGSEIGTNNSANSENSSEPKPAELKPAPVIRLRSRFAKPKPNIQKCLRKTDVEKGTSEKSSHSQSDKEHDKQQGETADIDVADHTISDSLKCGESKAGLSPKNTRLDEFHSSKPDSIENISERKQHTDVSLESKEETVPKSVKEHDKQQGDTADFSVADHTASGSPKCNESNAGSSPKNTRLLESNLDELHSPKPDSIEKISERKQHTDVSSESKEETFPESVKEVNADTIGSQAKENTNGVEESKVSSDSKNPIPPPNTSAIKRLVSRFPKPKPNFQKCDRRLGSSITEKKDDNVNYENFEHKHTSDKTEVPDKIHLVEQHKVSHDKKKDITQTVPVQESRLSNAASPFKKSSFRNTEISCTSSADIKKRVHFRIDEEGKQSKKVEEFDVSSDVAKVMLEPEVSSQLKEQGDTLQESSRLRTIAKRFPKPKPNLKVSERRLVNRESVNKSKEEKAVQDQNEKQTDMSSHKESTGKNDGSDSVEKSDKSVSAEVGVIKRKYASRRENASGPSRRRKRAALDQESFTMHDLIYWNPTDNPLRPSTSTPEESQNDHAVVEREEQMQVDVVPEKDADKEKEGENGVTDDSVVPGPRVTIGPNGEITIDESSLVVRRTPSTEVLSATAICLEEGNTTYTSFRSKQSSRGWSEAETKKFYKALSTVGTDFTLMSQLFPDRNRRELKLKFKREERCNMSLVDGALGSPPVFNLAEFHDTSENNASSGDVTKKKKTKTCRKRNKQTESAINDEVTIDCDSPPKKRKRRPRISQRHYLLSSSEEETVPEDQVKVSQTNEQLRKRKPTADLSLRRTFDEGTTIIELLLGNTSPAGESEHSEILQDSVLIPLDGQPSSGSATFQESNSINDSGNKDKGANIACEESVPSQCKETPNPEKIPSSSNDCEQQPKCLASLGTLANSSMSNTGNNTGEMLDYINKPCEEVTHDLENSVAAVQTQAVTTQDKDLPGLLSSPFVSQAPSSPKTPAPHKFLFLPKPGPNNEQIVHVFLLSDADKPDVEQGTHKDTAEQNVANCSNSDENNEHSVSENDLSHVQSTCGNLEQCCVSPTKETFENKIEKLSTKENDPPVDKITSVFVTPNAEANSR